MAGSCRATLIILGNRQGRRKQARWIRAVSHRKSCYSNSKSCSLLQQANSIRALEESQGLVISELRADIRRREDALPVSLGPGDASQAFMGVHRGHYDPDDTQYPCRHSWSKASRTSWINELGKDCVGKACKIESRSLDHKADTMATQKSSCSCTYSQ